MKITFALALNNEGVFEKLHICTKGFGMADDEAVGDLCRLAHHFTEFAGEFKAAVVGVYLRRLNAEGGTAH